MRYPADTFQFVAIAAVLPWLMLLGFCVEIYLAGLMTEFVIGAGILSVVLGLVAFWFYTRPWRAK